ncbi:mismatched base pair and cruciform DNA recognition protein [Penicillium taxi]|uniref:mismatched base pair and cruciform DNA recognition protein n=1 Tax=Penicillium taxi TaxID=168475 RepID=UPI0025459025|nr:mismatched base pair and cruciform DNA recognition protein [Penicillium taxi]KAJ5884773.1 mismatched base pair and cruciform DNA recognition protein [Penicillium taxi]
MSDNSSTIGSYVNAATGIAQRAVGAVTGDSSAQVKGDINQEKAQAEHDASHTTAKLGPISADPNTGAVAKDDSNRTTGSWDQTIGSAKESIGNLIGNDDLRRSGAEQNAAGKADEAKGQLKDLGSGISDRVTGAVGSVGAAIAGDRTEEENFRDQHDEGKVRQRGAEADISKA